MRWLEGSKDETERQIREGLDLARDRTDELSLRRAWSRLAEPELFPVKRRWPWVVASGGLMSAAALALLLLMPSGAGREAPGARAPEAATAAVLSSAAAASAASAPAS